MMPVYRKASDFPDEIAVFPLTGTVLLPRAPLPLNIFEPRYLNMVDDVLSGNRLIGMVQAVEPDRGEAGGSDLGRNELAGNEPGLASVGGVGRLSSFSETPDGRYLITLTGICRFHITAETTQSTPYRTALADFSRFEQDLRPDPLDVFDRPAFLAALSTYLQANDLATEWKAVEDAPAEMLVNSLAMTCPFTPAEKQALLEAETASERLDILMTLMAMGAAPGGADEAGGLQ